jgi:hypothetical protein
MDDWFAHASDELDPGLDSIVKPEIEPGERLLWAARGRNVGSRGRPPVAGISVTLAAATIFGLILVGLRSEQFHSIEGLLDIIAVLSALIAVIAFFITLSGWLSALFERRRVIKTTYALTDRRVVFWTPRDLSGGILVQSFQRGNVIYVQRVEYPDGSGDVELVTRHRHGWVSPPILRGIEQARQVEMLIRDVLVVDDSAQSPSDHEPPAVRGIR